MVIVKIASGLGNQMFQYALMLSLQSRGLIVKADLSKFGRSKDDRPYELGRVFNVNPLTPSLIEIEWAKTYSKVHGLIFLKNFRERYDRFGYFDQNVLEIKKGYLRGYWQTEQYFRQIEATVRSEFQFPVINDIDNLRWASEISGSESVSLHVRRTDFVDKYNWGLDASYYKRAVSYFDEILLRPIYYVFSDDLTWAKATLKGDNFRFIEGNIGAMSYRDMQLMSLCRHHIIANSSFSWWGAWLGKNPEKMVVAPDLWQPDFVGTRHIIPPRWVKLAAVAV